MLSAVPDTYKTYSDTTTALTASSGFKTYAQTMQGLSADGYATKADTTLTTIPDGNWIADPPTVEYQDTQVTTPIPHWYQDSGVVPEYFWEGAGWYVADSPGDYTYFGNDSRADSFSYTVLGSIPVVATRTLGSGYRLGPDDASNPNRDKPLASQDQMDVVAAQAAKADTAIQGVKLNGTALTADSGNVVNVTALTAHQAVSAVYSGQHIYLSANGARVGDIDCGDFVKDSVLSSAELCGSTLVFKFKVTSGQPQDPISVQLSSFIDDYDSDISQINQKITALSGSGVVHVTGDETAAGKKTFSDAFTVGTRKSGTYGTKSFTYGLNNLASGEGSFAGGQNCIASEAYAVAEGY